MKSVKIFSCIFLLLFMMGCVKTNQGYNCESGNCKPALGNAQYLTLADCKSDCSESTPQTPGTGTGNGNGTGTGTGSNTIKVGTFKVRIYKPSGTCASNSSWGSGRAFMGTMGGQRYDAGGNPAGFYFPVSTGGTGLPSNSSSSTYWDYTLTNMNKITWELWPNRSSFPTACSRKGESIIDVAGQTKEVVINW